jgi:hypothetical protein
MSSEASEFGVWGLLQLLSVQKVDIVSGNLYRRSAACAPAAVEMMLLFYGC